MPKKCSYRGCNRIVFSKGLCGDHWRVNYQKPIPKVSEKRKNQPQEKKQRKRIKQVSDKQKGLNAIYKVKRLEFLKDNPLCVLCKMLGIEGCTIVATEVHHTQGHGIFFLDETTWLATCRNGHTYELANSKKAFAAKVTATRIVPVEQIIMHKLKQ